MKILIVEDETRLADSIARGFREEGYLVSVSRDGEDARHRLLSEAFDLAILDVMLPKLDGWSILASLRSQSVPTRVLMLTARDSVEDKVRGLESGADDYLVKPFAFAELLARVRALLRRPVGKDSTQLRYSDLELDERSRRVQRASKTIVLSPKEFAVLAFLLRHPNETISRTRLAEAVWDENFDSFSNVIDVTVSHLRSKIDKGYSKSLIHTVRGSGYILSENDD